MSLISQQDRQLAIKALEHYKKVIPLTIKIGEHLSDTIVEQNEQELMEVNALINWIRLEYFKHEN